MELRWACRSSSALRCRTREHAGGVERVLGAEAVLLRSDTGEEVSADPLRITFLGAPELRGTVTRVAEETRYDDAGWAAATRRRDFY